MREWCIFADCIYVAACVRMSAGGGVTEAAKTVESENKVKRYETVDEKVGLLIERMSRCVDIVSKYMKGEKKSLVNGMREFPGCIDLLKCKLTEKQLTTALKQTFYWINELHLTCWHLTTLLEFRFLRNEMLNLMRIRDNLYTEPNKDGVLTVNTEQGPLIKWYREDKKYYVVAGEHDWNTKCISCLDRIRDVVLLPCKHFVMCRECSDEWKHLGNNTCPMCRETIDERVTVGERKRKGLPFITNAQFPGSEEHTSRLLSELQALGD